MDLLWTDIAQPNRSYAKTFSATSKSFNIFYSIQVMIHIPSLPAIGPSDLLHCTVNSIKTDGTVSDSGQVSCNLPEAKAIPQTPEDQGIVSVTSSLLMHPLSTQTSVVLHCNQGCITNGQSGQREQLPQGPRCRGAPNAPGLQHVKSISVGFDN